MKEIKPCGSEDRLFKRFAPLLQQRLQFNQTVMSLQTPIIPTYERSIEVYQNISGYISGQNNKIISHCYSIFLKLIKPMSMTKGFFQRFFMYMLKL